MATLDTGIVFDYNADLKTYSVSLDHRGEVLARRILTGVDKPYPRDSRVVLMRLPGLEWAIIGEVDMSPIPADADREKTVDEVAAEMINTAKTVRDDTNLGELPPYRPLEEELQFSGDASIENRTIAGESRSRVKVYSFGSVLALASNFCHTLWDRRMSRIVQQSRDLVTRAVGYVFTVITPIDTALSTYKEVVQGDAAARKEGDQAMRNTNDRETTVGYIPAPAGRGADLMTQPTAKFGERVKLREHRVSEVDNDSQSLRTRQDYVEYNKAGKEVKRTIEVQEVEGNLAEVGGKFGRHTRYREWLSIIVDNDTETVTIDDTSNGQSVVIGPKGIKVKRGATTADISEHQIKLNSKRISINALIDVTIKAPRIKVVTGPAALVSSSAAETVLSVAGIADILPVVDLSVLDGLSSLDILTSIQDMTAGVEQLLDGGFTDLITDYVSGFDIGDLGIDLDGFLSELPAGFDLDGLLSGLPAGFDLDGLLSGLPTDFDLTGLLEGLPAGFGIDELVAGLPDGFDVNGFLDIDGNLPSLSDLGIESSLADLTTGFEQVVGFAQANGIQLSQLPGYPGVGGA